MTMCAQRFNNTVQRWEEHTILATRSTASSNDLFCAALQVIIKYIRSKCKRIHPNYQTCQTCSKVVTFLHRYTETYFRFIWNATYTFCENAHSAVLISLQSVHFNDPPQASWPYDQYCHFGDFYTKLLNNIMSDYPHFQSHTQNTKQEGYRFHHFKVDGLSANRRNWSNLF